MSPEKRAFDPTPNSVLDNMLSEAIGPDTPMTDEAMAAGMEVVQARIARAQELIAGDSLHEGEEYDTEAVAAVMLIQEEREKTAARQQKIRDFDEMAARYWMFVRMELHETEGASFFTLHYPAPEEVTEEELDLMVEELQAQGWLAEIAHREPEDEDSPIGIKIASEVEQL